ncbi:MAG: hypothetical protein HGB26_05730 [Desulfobulbaceae bacterium]|nr:hypothetical protein [Desulfobulbaceae bacterium]
MGGWVYFDIWQRGSLKVSFSTFFVILLVPLRFCLATENGCDPDAPFLDTATFECANALSNCCAGIELMVFNDDATTDIIDINSSGLVAVSGGSGFYTFSTSSPGVLFTNGKQSITTNSPQVQMATDEKACGSLLFNVDDGCSTIPIYIRAAQGKWISVNGLAYGDCILPGAMVKSNEIDSSGGMVATVIRGRYMVVENIFNKINTPSCCLHVGGTDVSPVYGPSSCGCTENWEAMMQRLCNETLPHEDETCMNYSNCRQTTLGYGSAPEVICEGGFPGGILGNSACSFGMCYTTNVGTAWGSDNTRGVYMYRSWEYNRRSYEWVCQ